MDDLPQIHHLPLIALNDFAEFVKILAQDEDFPATYDAWEAHLDAREEEVLGAGHVPIFTGVNPTGFQQFVEHSTAGATLQTLIAYAALISSEAGKTN